jgi:hypothetical protein
MSSSGTSSNGSSGVASTTDNIDVDDSTRLECIIARAPANDIDTLGGVSSSHVTNTAVVHVPQSTTAPVIRRVVQVHHVRTETEGGASSSRVPSTGFKRKTYSAMPTGPTSVNQNLFNGETPNNGTAFGEAAPSEQVSDHSADYYKKKMLAVQESFDAYKNETTTTALNLKIINGVYIDSVMEQLKDHAKLIKIKNEVIAAGKVAADKLKASEKSLSEIQEKLAGIQAKYISTLNGEVDNLKNEVVDLKKNIEMRGQEAEDASDHHVNELETFRCMVTELRYATEFGESLSKGKPMCPVSRTTIMPKETVLMMYGNACDCNCMVKYEHATPFIEKYNADEDGGLKCLLCNKKIDMINVTTAENAVVTFSWYNLECLSGCDDLEDIYVSHNNKVEKEKADQALQDTSALRRQLEDALALRTELQDTLAVRI